MLTVSVGAKDTGTSHQICCQSVLVSGSVIVKVSAGPIKLTIIVLLTGFMTVARYNMDKVAVVGSDHVSV